MGRLTAGGFSIVMLAMAANAGAATPDYAAIFKGKNACFLLVDLESGKTVAQYNPKRCAQRVSACSTFKIPIAVMAFDQGILSDQDTPIHWDGVDRGNPDWNRDQTPKTWLKSSTVWVSQWITPQIGMEKIKQYLASFRYGNQDMSGGITTAWLSSTLKISPFEQVDFLRRFWRGGLAVRPDATDSTKASLPEERSASGDELQGKTGSGYSDPRGDRGGRQVGWFVGHLSSEGKEYVFALDFEDDARPADPSPGGLRARAMTKQILAAAGFFR
jgi:beta-lactamase class D